MALNTELDVITENMRFILDVYAINRLNSAFVRPEYVLIIAKCVVKLNEFYPYPVRF